jgi:hypothetical protein
MTDADRIRALRDEGRIDDAQAERLLQALGDIAAEQGGTRQSAAEPGATATPPVDTPADAGRAADACTRAAAAAAGASVPPPPPAPPGAPDPTATSERDARDDGPRATDTSPDVDRWARIDLFACALEVHVDAALDAPVADAVRGEVHVESHEGGWRIVQPTRPDGNWLDRLVDGVQQTRVTLRLPERTGIDLDVKAGDVELDGVPALRGRLMAGDLDARGLRAVDLAVNAGDVELELDPAPGLHRVRLSVGDLDVRLPDGADVRVEGHVSIGDASASPPFATQRSGMVAESLEGVMGEGRATLRIDVGTGDLKVEAPRHGR